MSERRTLIDLYAELLEKKIRANLAFNVFHATQYEVELQKIRDEMRQIDRLSNTLKGKDDSSELRKELQLKEIEIDELKAELAAYKKLEASMQHGAPNLETQRKIHALADYRKKEKQERGFFPKKVLACDSIPISPKTVKRHASELWKNWDDQNYQWQGGNWETEQI